MLQPTMRLIGLVARPTWDRRRPRGLPAALLSLALLLPAAIPAQSVLVTGVSTPPDGTYDRTLALHFTATFNAPVVISGSPRLTLRVGDRIRHATWTPPLGPTSATTALTFAYHPEPLDRDEDGIVLLGGVDLNGGAIRGMDTSPARLSFSPPETRGIRVNLRPPPAPGILGLTSGTGTKPGLVTVGDAFVLRGTADGGSVVTVMLADIGTVGATTAAPNGAWSLLYPPSLLSAGTHRLTATAENATGLVSAPSVPLELKVSSGASFRSSEFLVLSFGF